MECLAGVGVASMAAGFGFSLGLASGRSGLFEGKRRTSLNEEDELWDGGSVRDLRDRRSTRFSSRSARTLPGQQRRLSPSRLSSTGVLVAEDPLDEPLIEAANIARQVEEGKRALLPNRIVLLRHGESEGNIDKEVYRSKGDNLIELTESGSRQALEAGKKLAALFGEEKVVVFCSPFQRTYQTLRNVRTYIEDNIVRTEIAPELREQEFGNLQGDEFVNYRKEQAQVGRFFYRFPTGESSADVYERVEKFWNSIVSLNTGSADVIDNVLVVTHGLTIRLLLMQLYKWSPDTFETVYNLGNCHFYVLNKKLQKATKLPYELNFVEGYKPRSSRTVQVHFKDGSAKEYQLDEYISIPQPRTKHTDIAIRMLAEQHGFHHMDVASVDFFVDKKFAKYR